MIFWDVDLWVYASTSDSPLHVASRTVIETGSRSTEGCLFCPMVAASFLRLVTNTRVSVNPSNSEEAWSFVNVLESGERAAYGDVDQMTWGISRHLSMVSGVSGNGFPDALLAAIAIRHDAVFLTPDRGFTRFDGLHYSLVTEESSSAAGGSPNRF